MNSVLEIVATLLLLLDLSQAQSCQGRTGLFIADPNGPSPSYLQCASGQLFHRQPGPENLKKYRQKKLVKSNKSIFFLKLHFWQF